MNGLLVRGVMIGALALGVFFLIHAPHVDHIGFNGQKGVMVAQVPGTSIMATTTVSASVTMPAGKYADIAPPGPLVNPPSVVKAIYLTKWSGGSAKKIDSVIALLHRTELNAVVVDIKDYSGYVSYPVDVPEVKASGAEGEISITAPNMLLKKLHDAGIYVIGRVTVFQDPILAKAHPEWAFKNKLTGKTWTDSKGLAWMDPAGQGTRDYVISIAKDALSRGFDEINFDYVRFASDGTLGEIEYPFWDQKSPRSKVIKSFFSYLRTQLGKARLSADLFGLATVNHDDLGIGQVIENAYPYFDYVSPMVYPSHYATGFLGYKNPGAYPYEVMKYSLDHAVTRLVAMAHPPTVTTSTTSTTVPQMPPFDSQGKPRAKLRPWIQDFNLGATYTAAMVKKEFQAVEDSLNTTSTPGQFAGWLIWNPSNNYTEAALAPKQ